MQFQNGIKFNLMKPKISSQRQFLLSRRMSAKHELRMSENLKSSAIQPIDKKCKIRRKSCYCSQCGEMGRFQQLTANVHIFRKKQLRHNFSMETQVSPRIKTPKNKKSFFWRFQQQQTEIMIESQLVSRIDIQESLSHRNIALPKIEISQPISQRNTLVSQQQIKYFHGYNQKFEQLYRKDEPLNQWISQHSHQKTNQSQKQSINKTNYNSIIQKMHQTPERKISKEEIITRVFINPSLKLLSKHTKWRSKVVSP